MKLNEIQIRDPWVLPMRAEGWYYLYGTTDKHPWDGPSEGFETFRSRDLVNWEGPITVFHPARGFWGTTQYWAPEVWRMEDRFVMVASFRAPGVRLRASQALTATQPTGPFVPFGEPLTPPSWECLDATLYTEQDGSRWAVFSHEWVQIRDGKFFAAPLDSKLRPMGEPLPLFRASEAPWILPVRHPDEPASIPPSCYVTDGPHPHRCADGTLLLLWSSFGEGGYALAQSRSLSGWIRGPWEHLEELLVADDGGHGMVFRDFDGQMRLSFHQPNVTPDERAVFLNVVENDGRLVPE